MAVRVQEAASLRLDEIYRFTRERWGAEQADRYITDLFAAFDKIEVHGVASRPIPADFAIDGFYFRHEHYFVYWRRLSHGDIGIVTILHERMHQMDRFKGLAKYAEEHLAHFRRIEAVSKTKTGTFRMLDRTKASVRAEVLAATSAEGLYASSVATDYAQ